MNWDKYFISLAMQVKEKSKDQSTKVGAVIVGSDSDNSILSTGFNGFCRGVDETPPERWERPEKYDWVEHAERNAIYNAARNGVKLAGSSLYLVGMGPPTTPCINCARAVIQAGIGKVVGYGYKPAPDNWIRELRFSLDMLAEARVEYVEFDSDQEN